MIQFKNILLADDFHGIYVCIFERFIVWCAGESIYGQFTSLLSCRQHNVRRFQILLSICIIGVLIPHRHTNERMQ